MCGQGEVRFEREVDIKILDDTIITKKLLTVYCVNSYGIGYRLQLYARTNFITPCVKTIFLLCIMDLRNL